MPALEPTEHYGEVVWIGRVTDREASLRASALTEVEVGFGGIEGATPAGVTRPSCSRVISQHPRGTEIRNVRQLSILSEEELTTIGQEIGLTQVRPDQVGASLVLKGIPDFTHIPPSSRLQGPSGVTLIVDMESRPCHLIAPVIDEDTPGHGKGFKAAAKDRRGVTASVERPGQLRLGDKLRLHVPTQRPWAP